MYTIVHATRRRPAELEVRRRIAGQLLLEGKSVSEVARIVHASKSAVKAWKDAVVRHGLEGLKAKPHPPRKTTGPLDPVLCVAFSPAGDRIAAGVMNGAVKLWDLRVATASHDRIGPCGAQDGSIRTWTYGTGERLGSVKAHTGPIVGVCFAPDGQRLATASLDGTARVLSLEALSSDLD